MDKELIKEILGESGIFGIDVDEEEWYERFKDEIVSNVDLSLDNCDTVDKFVLNNSIVSMFNDEYCSRMSINKIDNTRYLTNDEVYLLGGRCVCIHLLLKSDCFLDLVKAEISIYEKEAVDCFYRENFDGKLSSIKDYFSNNYICSEDEFSVVAFKKGNSNKIQFDLLGNYNNSVWEENCHRGLIHLVRNEIYSIVDDRTKGYIGIEREY